MRRKAAEQATAFRVGATPAGWLGVVAGPRGVLEIVFEATEEAVRNRLANRYPGLREDGEGACAMALSQLQDFFAGRRRRFDLPLDLGGLTPFARDVLAALCQVPAGATVSYGELADRAGHPGAARAVGRVMAGNPLPLVVPCHRVVGASGALTGYSGASGVATKHWLLAFEERFA